MTKIERGAAIRTANAWDNFSTGTLIAIVGGVALADSPTPIMEVILQNDPGSAESAYVGNQHALPFILAIGASVTIPVCDLSLVYVGSAAGTARVNWMAGQ